MTPEEKRKKNAEAHKRWRDRHIERERQKERERWHRKMADPEIRKRANDLHLKWKKNNPDRISYYQLAMLTNPESRKKMIARVQRWKDKNPDKVKAIEQRFRRNRKLNVIDHYGGKCKCCGEDNPDFLTLDHVKNDGWKHRKEVGDEMYGWAIKNGFPDNLQLLCYNCNYAKGKLGYCPHEREDVVSRFGIG